LAALVFGETVLLLLLRLVVVVAGASAKVAAFDSR